MSVKHQRGDTLIEVMLAMAILTTIIIGSVYMMNFGIGNISTAVEHSEVRAGVNGQSGMLQYLRDDYMRQYGKPVAGSAGAEWAKILSPAYLNNGAISAVNDTVCAPLNAGKAFYLDDSSLPVPASIQRYLGLSPATFATAGKGLWIEAYQVVGSNPSEAAVDFLIRGCWAPPGSGPLQQEMTITRLYDGK
jgi:type II secretory pathway pseudopilin PulG